MKEIEFRDFEGNPQREFEREPNDTDDDILAKITYPKRVRLMVKKPPFEVILPAMDLLTFKANLHKFKPLSVVNYGDKRYSSVVVEERYD